VESGSPVLQKFLYSPQTALNPSRTPEPEFSPSQTRPRSLPLFSQPGSGQNLLKLLPSFHKTSSSNYVRSFGFNIFFCNIFQEAYQNRERYCGSFHTDIILLTLIHTNQNYFTFKWLVFIGLSVFVHVMFECTQKCHILSLFTPSCQSKPVTSSSEHKWRSFFCCCCCCCFFYEIWQISVSPLTAAQLCLFSKFINRP